MSTERFLVRARAALVILFMTASVRSAVDISGTIMGGPPGCTIDGSSFPTVIMVSSVPLLHPAQLAEPGVILDSATQMGPTGIPYSFTGLPDGPADYYVFAFRESLAGDGLPNGTECMGGYGPFPRSDSTGHIFVPSVGSFNASFPLTDRAALTGTVENTSSQTGQRLVVRADTWPTHFPEKEARLDLPFGPGGVFELGGLLSGDYQVVAFVDTDPPGSAGEGFPQPHEAMVSSGTFAVSTPSVQGVGTLLITGAGSSSGGPPDHLRLTDPWGGWRQVFKSSPLYSGELYVRIEDSFGRPSFSTHTMTVEFDVRDENWAPLPGVELSTDNFATTFSSLVVPASATATGPFRMRTPYLGRISLQVWTSDFAGTGQYRYAGYDLRTVSTGFTGVALRTSSQAPGTGVGVSSVTITPDYDSVDDAAVFSGVSPDPEGEWQLLIGTEPTFTGSLQRIYHQRSNDPVTWYGEGPDGRRLPNGIYRAALQTIGGGIRSPLLYVEVRSGSIIGHVVDPSSSPVRDAQVAVYGYGGAIVRSDADGFFYLAGLKPGQAYSVEASSPGSSTARLDGVLASTAPTPLALVLSPGATVRVGVVASSSSPYELFGHVFAHTPDYRSTAQGSLRLRAGQTQSDNGFPTGDVNFSTWTVLGVATGTAYVLDIELADYGRVTLSQTSGGSGSVVDVSTTLVKRAQIRGAVQLPAPAAGGFDGQWASVEAVPIGKPDPVAWGGAFLPNGSSSATYRVSGLPPGDYTLRASVPGYVRQTLGPITVVGTTDVTGADFPVFGSGRKISGTITIQGDSSRLSAAGWSPGCGPGQVPLHVGVWSAQSFSGNGTSVCFTTSTVTGAVAYQVGGLENGVYEVSMHVRGYEMSPPPPLKVTVAGADATQDLTFTPYTGALVVDAVLGAGHNAADVRYELSSENGPEEEGRSGAFTASGTLRGSATVTGLGTGFYRLAVRNLNPGSGLLQILPVAVRNGSTGAVTVDMSLPTYGVSGTVSVEGNILLGSTWNVTVSSMPGLAAALGGPPVLEAYAFPLPDHYEEGIEPFTMVPINIIPAQTSATFVLPGLTPGGYLLRLRQELNAPQPSAGCPDCYLPPGTPELASTNQVVYLGTAGVSGVSLDVSNGSKLSGTISRPYGDTSRDTRRFSVKVRRSDNLTVWQTSATTTGAGTADYVFEHLAAGTYLLELWDEPMDGSPRKYAARPALVEISGGDVAQDVTLVLAGSIVGRLRDADSQTLLNSQNAAGFLPPGFEAYARANPSVPGGWANAERDNQGLRFDQDTGQFRIAGLIPETTYDVSFRGFSDVGRDALAQGLRPYTPAQVSGVRVAPGQTVDIGTVDLRQGVGLAGTVEDAGGAPLPNILVAAVPTLSNGKDRYEWTVRAFTDGAGRFDLQGLDPGQRYYDILAAPRFEGDDFLGKFSGPRYGQETLRMVDVSTGAVRPPIVFKLSPADARISGRVSAVDGGVLESPFDRGEGDQARRGAQVFLHREGDFSDNPIGEIEETTEPDGKFSLVGLKPGAYTGHFIAVGYATKAVRFTLTAGQTLDLGAVTLEKGARVSGSIALPDGSNPSESDLRFIVGVDENLTDFVFGRLDGNSEAGIVTGYEINGFQPGRTYALIAGSEKDEMIELASGLAFADAADDQVLNLIYRRPGPNVLAIQSRAGDTYTLRFFCTQPLRNLTSADNDLTQIIAVDPSSGTLVSSELNPGRDTLTAVFQANPGVQRFIVRLSFYTVAVDPTDPAGGNFFLDKEFTFYAGIGRRRSAQIPNLTGGECLLEGDPSGVDFESGAFNVASSSNVEVGVQSADSPPAALALGAGPAVRRLTPAAYPTAGLYRVTQLAPSANPFSAFYDVFLPDGVSHQLKKDAVLTLKYDDSVSDPSGLNVYYLDEIRNVFLLEKDERRVDAENKTISVAVRHLSTFVVLESQAPIITANAFAGAEIAVHAFPNPFSLKSKSVTLADQSPPEDRTTSGTFIKIALPSGKSGEVAVEIHDIAGALVRTLRDNAPTGGRYYYLEWDGRNDGGDEVASGVYLARFTLNGTDERFFKMAVIK